FMILASALQSLRRVSSVIPSRYDSTLMPAPGFVFVSAMCWSPSRDSWNHSPMSTLTRDEVLRYSRHLVMPEVTLEGQTKLKSARVLCGGAGGLGSPLTLYLAAAGVGTIGVVDFDTVDLTNIQRQILYSTRDVGRPKLEAARERLLGLNPSIEIVS